MGVMNKLEYRRLSIEQEIEILRGKLNRLDNISGQEAMHLSVQLDKLILAAMKEKGYASRRQNTGYRIQNRKKQEYGQ